MARENKLYSKPRATSIAQDDLLTIGQLQSDGTYKVKTIERDNAIASLNARTVTYVQLQALVTASELIPMMWYKITNATSASFNLYVQAVAVNQIGCDAKDPLYPNDVVKYNFGSNVITWRWDTINNISCYEDFRNSTEIQIGANSKNIEIGSNATSITIGTDCNTLSIGNNCSTIIINNDCISISISSYCQNITTKQASLSINCLDNVSFMDLSANSQIEWDSGFTKNIFASFDGGNVVQYYNTNVLTSALIV